MSEHSDWRGKVAVVTGAASGIGRGLVLHAAALGMRVVAADIDTERLAETAHLAPGEVVTQHTDVTRFDSVTALAEAAYACFGAVHLLFNNAGVLVDGLSWERSVDDWRWQFDVNVMGVVHGIKAFVPRMLASGAEGVVVNTSSVGGLRSTPFLAPYCASKFAVFAVTESLEQEFRRTGARLRAAALCPTEVATGIWHSERVRPAERGAKAAFTRDDEAGMLQAIADRVAQGITPAEAARITFDGIEAGKFLILTSESYKQKMQARHEALMRDLLADF